MVYSDPLHEKFAKTRSGALLEIERFELLFDELFAIFVFQTHVGSRFRSKFPTFVAIEAEDERRGERRPFAFSFAHFPQFFGDIFVVDPGVHEGNLARRRRHQFESAPGRAFEPLPEGERVADRRGDQKRANVEGEKREGEFPHDPAFRVGKLVEFVHDDGGDVFEGEERVFRVEIKVVFEVVGIDGNLGKGNSGALLLLGKLRLFCFLFVAPVDDDGFLGVEGRRRYARFIGVLRRLLDDGGFRVFACREFREGVGRDKAVKENFRNHDEDRRVRVFTTVARDEPDVRALEAPLDRLLLELRVFLFR